MSSSKPQRDSRAHYKKGDRVVVAHEGGRWFNPEHDHRYGEIVKVTHHRDGRVTYDVYVGICETLFLRSQLQVMLHTEYLLMRATRGL
jgi:hypothetical protein